MSTLTSLGKVDASTRSRAVELLEEFPTVSAWWGYKAGKSEHATGRALDLMLYTDGGKAIDTALGDKIAEYIWAHRARLGLTHIIWRQRIRSTVVSPGKWRAMDDRGNDTENHRDHLHILFDHTPYTPPSKPTKPQGAPPVELTPAQLDKIAAAVWSAPVKQPAHPDKTWAASAGLWSANTYAWRANIAVSARLAALTEVLAQIASKGLYLSPEQITDAAAAGASLALEEFVDDARVVLEVNADPATQGEK